MINIRPYQGNSLVFFNSVIDSKNHTKNDPEYKNRLNLLKIDMANFYSVYDLEYSINNLINIKKIQFDTQCSNDLLSLYSYKLKKIKELKKEITKISDDLYMSDCPYCTINSINTLDHIMPKGMYPEYAVHPKNLFPACSQCNGLKTDKWASSNNTLEFLNLYLDIIPNSQYLFVNIDFNNTLSVNFNIRNINGIDPILFNRIQRHYNNLNLLDRFNKKSHVIISEFLNSVKAGIMNSYNLHEILKTAHDAAILNSQTQGINHYKVVLQVELCQSQAFKDYCLSQGIV